MVGIGRMKRLGIRKEEPHKLMGGLPFSWLFPRHLIRYKDPMSTYKKPCSTKITVSGLVDAVEAKDMVQFVPSLRGPCEQ